MQDRIEKVRHAARTYLEGDQTADAAREAFDVMCEALGWSGPYARLLADIRLQGERIRRPQAEGSNPRRSIGGPA